MKVKTVSVLIAILILALAVTVAGADPGGPTPITPDYVPPVTDSGEMVNESPTAWFVEFTSSPLADGGSSKNTNKDKVNFRNAANKAGIAFTERFEFEILWNGISIKIDPVDVSKLATLPGVKAIYPVFTVSIPETFDGSSPELFTAIQMTGADIAQNELGYTGAGVKVAVMDTGIDYDHPDLGGCFGPGCRVAFGYDLVGDAYNADDTSPTYNPIPSPDPYPDDCQGHGTHVAGIVGASGTVTGVAPEVTFGAYRVFGCEGSTDADIMIAAMEMALKDKMDILNMSIGSAFTWPEYPTAQAANRLVKKGMVVVASIGNSGANGLYSAGAPGLGKDVIGVASFDNTDATLPYFEVNAAKIGYVAMTFAGPTPTSGTEEIVYIGRGCSSLGDPVEADPTGKVALLERGACSFGEKATTAINAGAIAVVIHNNAPGVFNGTLGAPIDGVTPVVGISQEDGLFIRGEAAPVMMTWTDQLVSVPSPTAGLISSFSSYGLAPDLSFKPDIAAPGGSIYSTYPLEQGGYATLGGTSMASPHVAGAAALLLEAQPGLNAYTVRDVLQNSADPQLWSLAPYPGYLEYVHRQGAGMVDVDDAILATTLITPAKIATGESETGPFTQELKIANNGDTTVTYDLYFEEAIATTGITTVNDYWLYGTWVDFDQASVTVEPGQSATVTATIYPPAYPDTSIYGGYIVFAPQGGGQEYSVPFAGYVGDYQDIQAMSPGPYGMPWLAISLGGSFYGPVEGPADWVYTMVGEDVPYLLIHFDHQVELLRVEIFKASNMKPLHPKFSTAIYEEYLPRNATSGGFFAFAWDGTRIHSNGYNGKGYTKNMTKPVADGEYILVVNALKANGNPDNPDHWETWTSPIVAIDRP